MKKVIINVVLSSLFLFYFTVNASNDTPEKGVEKTNFHGKVIDKLTGETLAGVVIAVDGTDIKVYSDLEGNYSINGLKAGKYTVSVNYISYRKDIRNIEVKDNVSKDVNILLEPVKN